MTCFQLLAQLNDTNSHNIAHKKFRNHTDLESIFFSSHNYQLENTEQFPFSATFLWHQTTLKPKKRNKYRKSRTNPKFQSLKPVPSLIITNIKSSRTIN
jgi:hypothetical protein